MKKYFLLTILFFFCIILNGQSVKIMLVTGGHSYDTVSFFQLFDSLEAIEYEYFSQPDANKIISNGKTESYDVLVFYDMWQKVSPNEKQAYIHLTKEGKPFLFLHHALASYQSWEGFEKILGGRYVEKSNDIPVEEQSTYRHDVWVDCEIVDPQHPVTQGISDFRLFDEVYGNFSVSPGVKPLLKTNHPESSPLIGWENQFNASTVVYLQPGHGPSAFDSSVYRKLLFQSINYLAGLK